MKLAPKLAAAALLPVLAAPASASCPASPGGSPSAVRHQVTARDIIELNEIGFPDGAISGPSPLAVSPDGWHVAFVVTRADIASDSYCRSLLVVDLRGGRKPQVLERGGEFMPLTTSARGLSVEVGLQGLATPAWSPDGKSIAILKREKGVTQAVILPVAGRAKPQSTRSAVDVEDLWWSTDSRRLFFASRPSSASAARKIDREGEGGWLYDDRIAPNYGARPRPEPADAPAVVSSLDRGNGRVDLAPGQPVRTNDNHLVSRLGAEAWLARESPSPVSGEQLWVKPAAGKSIACAADACRGRFGGLWWAADGTRLWFLKREGWHHGTSAIYEWDPAGTEPRRTLATEDMLDNCVPTRSKLACTTENSTHPRRIVLVDPSSGSVKDLFDPNPQFASIVLGPVQRLRFRTDRGLESWGDLVLPPSDRGGERVPLIIVQYSSRGFLRGGTGNEYPIFPLAAAGYAVLSIDRPAAVASLDPTLRTDVELNAANEKDWAERKSMQSAIIRGIDLAIASGAVDPKRIGITGLSDGATAARYALLNSDRIAAAAISSCCLEPKTVMTYGGMRWAEFNRAIGYPPASVDAPDFWRPVSMVVNAGRIHTPLLIQQSDDEYLLSLEAVEALREKQAPVELYIFPDEHHIKWQPRHKLAVFRRTLDWFDFWLKCEEDPDGAKAAQYRRWEAMRATAGETAALCPTARIRTTTAPTPRHPRGA